MAAGAATLRFIQSERLDRSAAALGHVLMEQLIGMQKQHACIGEVRGRGLMLGMELVDPQGKLDTLGHPPAHRELAAAVQAACLSRGLIVEMGGRYGSTLRLLPPLIITASEIGRVVAILDDSIREAAARVLVPSGQPS
jgi:diaminobutyrate-2-oxoglutarate transaminase